MLSRKTVFVLGAGASFELKLPVGDKLKDEISLLLNITFPDGYNQKSGDYQICQLLREMANVSGQGSINDYLHKCWLIRDALPGALSIDNLLDAHRNDPDIPGIGKLAIAKAILQAEQASKLFKPSGKQFKLEDVSDTWLIPLLQLLTENVAREEVGTIFDNISFIVFNYDRCLEHFLPRALEIYYGLSKSEADAVAAKANIIHPYGRVGEYASGRALEAVSFGADRFDLSSVAKGIRTFSEGLKLDSHHDIISEIMSRAEQVVFLGFAFHPLNMEILKPSSFNSVKKIFGTTLGLSEAAVRSVENTMTNIFGKERPDHIQFPGDRSQKLQELNLEPRTAVDFMRAHFRGVS